MLRQIFAVALVTAFADAHQNKPVAAHIRRPELYAKNIIKEGMLGAAPAIDIAQAATPYEAGMHPKLEKFKQDIYSDVEYSSSATYDYIQAFYIGFQFDKYNKGQQCF